MLTRWDFLIHSILSFCATMQNPGLQINEIATSLKKRLAMTIQLPLNNNTSPSKTTTKSS